MSTNSKFVIVAGKDYDAKIIIKATGSTTALELVAGDTGTFTLLTIGVNPVVLLNEIDMTISDGINGEMSLHLTDVQTTDLPSEMMFGEDGFPLSPTCMAVLDITSQAEGKIFARIPQVYVQDIGL